MRVAAGVALALSLGASQVACHNVTVKQVVKPIAVAVLDGVCGAVLDHANATPEEQAAIDIACSVLRGSVLAAGPRDAKRVGAAFFVPARPIEAQK